MNKQIAIDSFWMPKDNSTLAGSVDWAFYLINWINLAFFVLIVGLMVYCVVKFKRKTDNDQTSSLDHHLGLEIAWTFVPLVIVLVLFVVGFRGFIAHNVIPGDAYEIHAVGQKWAWSFTYPEGVTKLGELRVPKGRPIKILMSSKDVLHSIFIPEFRVKQDAVPGLYTSLWFEAREAGETMLLCTEYCGTDHSNMLARVIIMEPDAFAKWLDNGGDDGPPLPPAEKGKKLYASAACETCHSLDGSPKQAPSFKGLFGREEELIDGSKVTVDENYLKESIVNPAGKVVKGYTPIMPVFKGVLSDKDIDALIAFIKTVK